MDIVDRLHGDALTHRLTDDAITEIERLRSTVAAIEAERDRLAGENRKLHSAHQRIYFYQQGVGHPPLHSVAEGMRMIAHAALAGDGDAK